jgi:hypothetical protein
MIGFDYRIISAVAVFILDVSLRITYPLHLYCIAPSRHVLSLMHSYILCH